MSTCRVASPTGAHNKVQGVLSHAQCSLWRARHVLAKSVCGRGGGVRFGNCRPSPSALGCCLCPLLPIHCIDDVAEGTLAGGPLHGPTPSGPGFPSLASLLSPPPTDACGRSGCTSSRSSLRACPCLSGPTRTTSPVCPCLCHCLHGKLYRRGHTVAKSISHRLGSALAA